MYLQASKKGKDLTLLIYGVIGRGWFSDVSADEVNRELLDYGEIENIIVRIHSPGGSIAEGCAIYNSLKRHPAKVKVFVDGMCASIATVIAMAGDEIIMSPVSSMMIHNPLTMGMEGGADDLRKRADLLDQLKEVIINSYVTKSKLEREEISKLMDAETTFNANEALEKGFATKIEGQGKDLNYITESFDLSCFKSFKEDNLNIKKQKPKEEDMNIKDMTLEQFKNEHPEMFEKIKNKGVEGERNRIKALDEITNKYGETTAVNKAKYETFKDVNNIAFEILEEVNNRKEDSKNLTGEKTPKKENFLNKFEDRIKEAEESGVNGIGELDKGKVEEENINKDISAVVALANQEV